MSKITEPSNIKPYAIQTLYLSPDDVILLHLGEDYDFDDMQVIQNEVMKAFPKNRILVVNDNVLKRITIFKADNPNQAEWLNDTIEQEIRNNQFINSLSSDSTGGYVTGTYTGSPVYDILY